MFSDRQNTSYGHNVKPVPAGRNSCMSKFPLFLFCCALIFLAAACVRHNQAQSAELTTLHAGSLKLPDNPDAPKLVYVHASANAAPYLEQYLCTALKNGKFRMTGAPSKAGYILHVKVLREGQVAPDALRAAVQSGYGGKTGFHGSGAQAMLVDALMVQRRVPSAKRPSRQRLKNITSRNALGSSQMRIAVMARANTARYDDFSRAIAKELALSLERAD